jgi:hypothetical protein
LLKFRSMFSVKEEKYIYHVLFTPMILSTNVIHFPVMCHMITCVINDLCWYLSPMDKESSWLLVASNVTENGWGGTDLNQNFLIINLVLSMKFKSINRSDFNVFFCNYFIWNQRWYSHPNQLQDDVIVEKKQHANCVSPKNKLY